MTSMQAPSTGPKATRRTNVSSDTASAQTLIRNLYSRYAHTLDGGDAAGFADCFTEDAGFHPNTGPFQPDRGRFSGREAIASFVGATGENRPRHLVLNLWIDVRSEDTAHATALFMLMDTTTGDLRALGEYSDDLQRGHDGAWRFSEKRVRFVWQSEAYRERADAMVTADDRR